MTDRKSKFPGRFKIIYVEQGDGYVVADIVRADEPEEEGTLLAKRTILPDSVAQALGLVPETATPAEAFAVLAESVPPEIAAVVVAENELTSIIEFVNSDGSKNVIESSFSSEGELQKMAINGRSINVTWGQSSGGGAIG